MTKGQKPKLLVDNRLLGIRRQTDAVPGQLMTPRRFGKRRRSTPCEPSALLAVWCLAVYHSASQANPWGVKPHGETLQRREA